MKTIADFHGIHAGQTVALVGNGPSLLWHDYSPVYDAADATIGVHYAWRHTALDYLLFIDTGPIRQAMAEMPEDYPATVFARTGIETPENAKLAHVWVNHQMTDTRLRIHQGMETREFCETGLYPNQCFPKGIHPGNVRGNTLFMHHSSVMPALHLAVIMGFARIILVAVDCGGEQKSCANPDHFDDSKRAAMKKHEEQLREFLEDWGATIKCQNASPIYTGSWEKWSG